MYPHATGSAGSEKRIGTALPMFARKRPRMALMAFSNSQCSTNGDHTQHRGQDKNVMVRTTSAWGKENHGGYNHAGGGDSTGESTKWSAYKPTQGRTTTAQPRSNSYWDESHDLQVTKDTASSSGSTTNNDQVILGGGAGVNANTWPPVQKDHVIQSQLMNSVHLLTATSQGVQHWAGYQQQITIMFEVFGTLSSLMEQGEMGAKKFTLQAVDGPLNCVFWEIDYKIPAGLTRGRLCRVIGKWDAQKTVLKCVSIRLANPNEWNSVKTMVATSDKYMREMASSLNEI